MSPIRICCFVWKISACPHLETSPFLRAVGPAWCHFIQTMLSLPPTAAQMFRLTTHLLLTSSSSFTVLSSPLWPLSLVCLSFKTEGRQGNRLTQTHIHESKSSVRAQVWVYVHLFVLLATYLYSANWTESTSTPMFPGISITYTGKKMLI